MLAIREKEKAAERAVVALREAAVGKGDEVLKEIENIKKIGEEHAKLDFWDGLDLPAPVPEDWGIKKKISQQPVALKTFAKKILDASAKKKQQKAAAMKEKEKHEDAALDEKEAKEDEKEKEKEKEKEEKERTITK